MWVGRTRNTRSDVLRCSHRPEATGHESLSEPLSPPRWGGSFVGCEAQAAGARLVADIIYKPQATSYRLWVFASPTGEVAAKPPEGGGLGRRGQTKSPRP